MIINNDVSVVIPTIPSRENLLARAYTSVEMQTLKPSIVIIEKDNEWTGAALTRQRALNVVTTKWVAFLDDDDYFDNDHLKKLVQCALDFSADYVWSRFRIQYPNGKTKDGPAPLGSGSFKQWDDNDPAQTTITTLVRTELANECGGFTAFKDDPERKINGQRFGEDFDFTLRCRDAGGSFRHHPEVTWTWSHWGGNLSGKPPPNNLRNCWI